MANTSTNAQEFRFSALISARNLIAAALVATGLFLVYGAVLFTESSQLIQIELTVGFVVTIAGLGIYALGRKHSGGENLDDLATQ